MSTRMDQMQCSPQVTACTEKEQLKTMNDDQRMNASPQTQITPVQKIHHHYLEEEWQNVAFELETVDANYSQFCYDITM